MALTNAQRQKLWRERHPEVKHARLEAYKEQKAERKRKKTVMTDCGDHDDRGVRVTLAYCGKCRSLVSVVPGELEKLHARWLSRPSERDCEP